MQEELKKALVGFRSQDEKTPLAEGSSWGFIAGKRSTSCPQKASRNMSDRWKLNPRANMVVSVAALASKHVNTQIK
jgi:hypothetical protein